MSRARELSKLGNANAISVDTSNNVGLGTTSSIQYKLDVVGDANFTGVITATAIHNADGVAGSGGAGIGTELDSTAGTLGNLIYKTPRNYAATGISSIYINSDTTSGDVAFTRLGEIHLGVGVTLHIGAGTTMIMNVLNLF